MVESHPKPIKIKLSASNSTFGDIKQKRAFSPKKKKNKLSKFERLQQKLKDLERQEQDKGDYSDESIDDKSTEEKEPEKT